MISSKTNKNMYIDRVKLGKDVTTSRNQTMVLLKFWQRFWLLPLSQFDFIAVVVWSPLSVSENAERYMYKKGRNSIRIAKSWVENLGSMKFANYYGAANMLSDWIHRNITTKLGLKIVCCGIVSKNNKWGSKYCKDWILRDSRISDSGYPCNWLFEIHHLI